MSDIATQIAEALGTAPCAIAPTTPLQLTEPGSADQAFEAAKPKPHYAAHGGNPVAQAADTMQDATRSRVLGSAPSGGLFDQIETRNTERLRTISKQFGWPSRLPFDLAMDMAPAGEVFADHGISDEDALKLLQHAVFVRTVKEYKEIIAADGLSFKAKARIAAEALIPDAYNLATDPAVSAGDRLKAIQHLTKVAGLEPKGDEDKGTGGGGGGFKLEITFSGAGQQGAVIEGQAQKVVEGTAIASVPGLQITGAK